MTDNTEIDHDVSSLPEGHCNRVAFIIDAKSYFRAVAEAIGQAERSVLIIGWDIDSRIRLDKDNGDLRLYELLNSAVENRPELQIHILIWDYPLAYSMDREPLQQLNFPRKTHPNIHFRLDSEMPLGSSHHQKVVVVDDKVAFTGGIDLTAARWDTLDHLPEDARRKKPNGQDYGPYHDIQMAVDGEVAVMLGDMARKRWEWATGNVLQAPALADGGSDPWPASVAVNLEDIYVTMALTLPPFKGRKQVREVESLYLHYISGARERIYIENQYFSSAPVRDALIAKLQEPEGPEVLIIMNQMPTGLLEKLVMEPLQSDVFDALYKADTHNRLAVFCPFADRDGTVAVKVHAKLLMVDDTFITVGSANLNDRSMGLDSECNLAVSSARNNEHALSSHSEHGPDSKQDAEANETSEGAGNTVEKGGKAAQKVAPVLRHLRQRLIAHHLGITLAEYRNAEHEDGSMLAAVSRFREESGRLLPEPQTRMEAPLPVDPKFARPLDSSRPNLYDSILDEYSSPDNSRTSYARLIGFAAVLVVFALFALLWRYTPLSEYANPDSLLQWAGEVRAMPLAPLIAVAAFVLGGFIMFPVTLMIVLTASVFPPVLSFFTSLAGCILSSLSVYFVGEFLGHDAVKNLAGPKITSLSKLLGKHGLVSIMVARVIPVAPFSVINLVAGASHIRLRIFVAGTFIGMFPGIIAMTLFGSQLIDAIKDPGMGTIGLLVLVVLAVVGFGTLLRRRLKRMHDDLDRASDYGKHKKESGHDDEAAGA